MIVTDERVAEFVGRLTGKKFCPPYSCAGIERNGQIIGGVVFNVYEKPDIHITVAGNVFSREFLRKCGEYVFDQLGCERATAITEQAKVVDLAERLGGQVEGLMRHHFGHDRHGVVLGILKGEYRY
jgi:RimJ/RimL family protein N-acetyltransferase